jgi:small subunit ribosomal protein S8
MSLQSTDPIADMLTRVRNAINVGKNQVSLPTSKLKETIARELQKAGYLAKVEVEKAAPRDNLIITINEAGTNPTITEISRVSKPGRRVYSHAADLPRVKSGRGIMLVSTSRGIMTNREAIKQHLGGELICQVY